VPKEFLILNVNENISSTKLRNNVDIKKLPEKNRLEIAKYYKENNAKK
jgi:hypothetical protein